MKIKISKNIPRWYEFDSSWRNEKLVEDRIKDIKQVDKEFKTITNIKVQKQNEYWYNIYTYMSCSVKNNKQISSIGFFIKRL